MSFAGRILWFILRPIYRAFFKRPLRWGLAKLKTFLLADATARLQRIEQASERLPTQLRDAETNLAAQLHILRAELVPYLQRTEASVRAIDANLAAHLPAMAANNSAQWDALEQLLLAMFRLPESRPAIPDVHASEPDRASFLTSIDLNQINAVHNLR